MILHSSWLIKSEMNLYLLIKGKVRNRSEESINPNLRSGKIEIFAEEIFILNASDNPPYYN